MAVDIGLIGLAVMGENLALNFASKGYGVGVYDIREGVAQALAQKSGLKAADSLEQLIEMLEKPRKVMLMIRAGSPVDEVIASLLPLLSPGDVIIDGGNSFYEDTIRRTKLVESHGLLYIGTGISGGEEGALKGPSIMPGGSAKAWPIVQPLLQAIAAKDTDGSVCCEWVGSNGAGHYVKMVHNGIEYGDMQLICEAYQLLRTGLDMTPAEIQSVFQEWNRGGLSGYLTEITGNILGYLDTDNVPLIDKILDAAGQKGTGKWTVNAALNEGIDLSLISEAVFARCISAMKEERVYASTLLEGPSKLLPGDRKMWIDWVADALYAGKIVSYAQGFSLLKSAAKTNHWDLDYSKISLLWRGGCIIRSAFLKDITAAFNLDPSLPNLLCDEHFRKIIHKTQTGWRNVCANAMLCGIPIPAMSASLSFYDSYRSERLPANLLQAQRDYFGAHTYQRLDAPLSQFFHTNWTSEGGSTASSVYSV